MFYNNLDSLKGDNKNMWLIISIIVIIIIIIILVVVLMPKNKNNNNESFQNMNYASNEVEIENQESDEEYSSYLNNKEKKNSYSQEDAQMQMQQYNDNSQIPLSPQASEPDNKNEIFKNLDYGNQDNSLNNNQLPKDCYPKDQLSPSELLPGNSNSVWAQVNPSGQGDLKDQNFLNAGHHIGVNTVGQTLRNANLQLRSEPPNPQAAVSPWLQSTIEPDTNRRPMEIGGCD